MGFLGHLTRLPRSSAGSGWRVEVQKDGAPLNYDDTRAAAVLQWRDPQDLADQQMSPGSVQQFTVTGNGFVDKVARWSGSIWQGALATMKKSGDGSGHAYTFIGELGPVGPGGYNELGGLQGELTNTGSADGTMSGVEVLLKDGPDEQSARGTQMHAVIARVKKHSPDATRSTVGVLASSEGSRAPDAAFKAVGAWRRGVDLTCAVLDGFAAAFPNNRALAWVDGEGRQRPVLSVAPDDTTFIRPASAAASISLQHFDGSPGLSVEPDGSVRLAGGGALYVTSGGDLCYRSPGGVVSTIAFA